MISHEWFPAWLSKQAEDTTYQIKPLKYDN